MGLPGAWLGFYGDAQIERRPRGASRASPLLHLLQRAMACEAIVASLVGMTQFFGWRCRRSACLQPCAKAANHGLTGTARCNKCRSGLARDAPRGRRSISRALKIPRQALHRQLRLTVAGALPLTVTCCCTVAPSACPITLYWPGGSCTYSNGPASCTLSKDVPRAF